MKLYETRLDDAEAAELLDTVAEDVEVGRARVVGLADALSAADAEALDRLLDVDREYVDEEIELEDGETSALASLLPGAMRVVLASPGGPVFVRYDDDTTFFVATPEVAERYGAEEASDAGDRGVVREMQADAEAYEALEDG